MAYPTAGGSSAALKGCATRKKVVRDVLRQAPRRLSENAVFLEARTSRPLLVRAGSPRSQGKRPAGPFSAIWTA